MAIRGERGSKRLPRLFAELSKIQLDRESDSWYFHNIGKAYRFKSGQARAKRKFSRPLAMAGGSFRKRWKKTLKYPLKAARGLDFRGLRRVSGSR
jgi:hypothetical protein